MSFYEFNINRFKIFIYSNTNLLNIAYNKIIQLIFLDKINSKYLSSQFLKVNLTCSKHQLFRYL